MPGNALHLDVPTERSGNTEQQLNRIENYLKLLVDQLRYEFRHLNVTNVPASAITDLGSLDAAAWMAAIGAQPKLGVEANKLSLPIAGKTSLVLTWGRNNVLSGTDINYGVTYDATPTVLCGIQGPSTNVWGCRPNDTPGTEKWAPVITRIVSGAGAEDTVNKHVVHWLAIGTVTET